MAVRTSCFPRPGSRTLDSFSDENSLAVSGSGRVMLRMWPLLVESLWFEDDKEHLTRITEALAQSISEAAPGPRSSECHPYQCCWC